MKLETNILFENRKRCVPNIRTFTITDFYFPARRSAPPLDVSGLPGYDKITDREREVSVQICPS